jgi:hypothetical protein
LAIIVNASAETNRIMSDLTREQFQAAVAAAIAGVEQLYREVDLLIARLREELAEEPEPLMLKRGTLGKAGKEESKRVVVRYEYGALFEPAADDDDLDEDDDLDDEDGDEDEDIEQAAGSKAQRKRGKGRHEITASQPLLAVRIAMFDPRKRASFEPQIQFAVMSEWALGDTPVQPEDRFTLQAYMLRRIARALADRAGVASGARIRTSAAARGGTGLQKGKSRKLSCSLPAGVQTVPLYSIDTAQALESLAEQMKQMWISVTGT